MKLCILKIITSSRIVVHHLPCSLFTNGISLSLLLWAYQLASPLSLHQKFCNISSSNKWLRRGQLLALHAKYIKIQIWYDLTGEDWFLYFLRGREKNGQMGLSLKTNPPQ